MLSYLKLVRFWNLVMVAALQYLLLYCLIKPSVEVHYSRILGIAMTLQFSNLDFLFLVLSTVFITAAGYVINDYFDLNTDLINRPSKVIIGKTVGLTTALALHWVLNIAGVILGFYISWKMDLFNVGFIFVFAAGLLWFYSTIFNKELFIGNIIVAALVAMVPILVILFEIIPLNYVYVNPLRMYYMNFNIIAFWGLGFAYFAFITNLIREIIKDIQDLEGDRVYGRKSIPIVFGIRNAKIIVTFLLGILLASLVWAILIFVDNIYGRLYIAVCLALPTLVLMVLLALAKRERNYFYASVLMKGIMVAGVAFLFIIYKFNILY